MDDPLPPNPYKTLGIPRDASLTTIRSAHRKLVLTCHPDKVHEESRKAQAADQFHQIQQAYEVLSDDTRRQQYDERIRLIELRAEKAAIMKEKGGPRIIPEYSPRPSGHSPTFEVRGGRRHEEIVPNRRSSEDDDFRSKYSEGRSNSRKYDDQYDTPQAYRKTSGRPSEERRKTRDVEEERERERHVKERQRAAEKLAQAERRKSREKERRYNRRAVRDYETSSESDSDVTETHSSRKRMSEERRYEKTRRRDRDDPPRWNSKRDEADYDDDLYPNASHYHTARDYIQKSRPSGPEPEPRRPAPYRSSSKVEYRQPPPPPPPPIDPRHFHAGRTRGGGDSPPKPAGRERRPTEIVEPSKSYDSPSRKPPSMPSSTSAPSAMKHFFQQSRREQPLRATTMHAVPEAKPSPLRRAETMYEQPSAGSRSRRNDAAPIRLSKLKTADIHDSGYSSPETPDTPYTSVSPKQKSTHYQIYEDEEDLNGPRTVMIGQEESDRRRRESSKDTRHTDRPRSDRPHSDRPPMPGRVSTSSRVTPSRSTPYVSPTETTPPSRTVPPFVRTQSGRPSPVARQSSRGGALYGEMVQEPYKIQNQRPKIQEGDIRYSYPRRGSEGTARDAYPRSQWPSPQQRPVPTQ